MFIPFSDVEDVTLHIQYTMSDYFSESDVSVTLTVLPQNTSILNNKPTV